MPLTTDFKKRITSFKNKKIPNNLFAYWEDKTYLVANRLVLERIDDKLRLVLQDGDNELSEQYVSNTPVLKNGDRLIIDNLVLFQEFKFNNDQLIPFEK
jgi:hypothetical protein